MLDADCNELFQGEPVYVNFARKEDFETLVERGIDLKGKVGISRFVRHVTRPGITVFPFLK